MACCRSVLASLVLACVVGWDQTSGTTFQYNRQRGAWERIISQQQSGSGKSTEVKTSDKSPALIKTSSQLSVITKRLLTHLDSVTPRCPHAATALSQLTLHPLFSVTRSARDTGLIAGVGRSQPVTLDSLLPSLALSP